MDHISKARARNRMLRLLNVLRVPEQKHYSFVAEDYIIGIGLNHHNILVRDCLPSLSENSMINLAERNIVDELPQEDKPKKFQNCWILFLQRNNLYGITSSFFDTMPNLHFLDLSEALFSALPSSLFKLSKLKVLLLRNCINLKGIPSEIDKLDQLEVLDLSAGTQLYYIPYQIHALTRLKHLQLSFYGPSDDKEYLSFPSEPLISQCVLSELKALEALSIIVHPQDLRWRNIASCVMRDVACLERLVFVDSYFPETEGFEDFIQTSRSWAERGYIRKFKFVVGDNVVRMIVKQVPDDEVESIFDQQDRYLRFVNGEQVPQAMKVVLRHATAFYLDHHVEIRSLSEFGVSNFEELKFCLVRHCLKIWAILVDDGETTGGAFPSLQYLWLYSLCELEFISEKLTYGPGCENFKELKHLTVNYCPKLHFIFHEAVVRCVSKLEELVIVDCESLESIIYVDEEMTESYNAPRVALLPKLRRLVLRSLPNLVSLGNGLCLSQGIMSIYGCPKLLLNKKTKGRFRLRLRRVLCGYI